MSLISTHFVIMFIEVIKMEEDKTPTRFSFSGSHKFTLKQYESHELFYNINMDMDEDINIVLQKFNANASIVIPEIIKRIEQEKDAIVNKFNGVAPTERFGTTETKPIKKWGNR